MHHLAKVDWSFALAPDPPTGASHGLGRSVLVGPNTGAVHTELAIGKLASGGWITHHVHSFEESLYLLAGELTIEIDGHAWRLAPGDFAFIPIGTWHALANLGDDEVRWLAFNTPQRLDPAGARKDTFFRPGALDLQRIGEISRPRGSGPSVRYVGHYEGTPPQLDALRIADPARGRAPAGMDTALLAYSGISVKMLIDRGFGADLLTMFTVDYEVGGAAQPHDHPFEEAYFFLSGEIEAEIDGETHTLRAGDVLFAGVGSTHGFYNMGPERVRWIETQAPQPPVRHAYRWVQHWADFDPSTAP